MININIPKMEVKIHNISIYILTISIFYGCFLLYGFFPVNFSKPISSNYSDFNDLPYILDADNLMQDQTLYRREKFNRTIIMIIDAMRIDFMKDVENMPQLNELIRISKACFYKLKVEAPTVTMPRIKAITSGTIPNFIDIVLNFGSAEFSADNFLYQISKKLGKINFCGDNTWIKMFPNLFHRKLENSDSFFVNDFYEGDKNITEHLLNIELNQPIEWKLLLLHYLGLDHIGHVFGPFDSKIPLKLQDMDNVIGDIYAKIQLWNESTLFLITGDHGMRDSGGHGGSTFAEMNVPLVAISAGGNDNSFCSQTKKTYNQIDFAPTISILLGLPIPAVSIGTIITELLTNLSEDEQLYALYYNTNRLFNKLSINMKKENIKNSEFAVEFNEAKVNHRMFLKYVGPTIGAKLALFKRVKSHYISSSQIMSQRLTKYLIKYDQICIFFGIIGLSTILIVTILHLYMMDDQLIKFKTNKINSLIIVLLTICLKQFVIKLTEIDSIICDWNFIINLILILFIYSLRINYVLAKEILISHQCSQNIKRIHPFLINCLIFGIFFQTFSMASSSFIEEEHQIWHYLLNTTLILFFIRKLLKILMNGVNLRLNYKYLLEWIGLLLLMIFIRKLNQTGDKWISIPDIGDWLVKDENKIWLSLFVIISLIGLYFSCRQFNNTLINVLLFTSCLLIYYYRAVNDFVLLPTISLTLSKRSLLLFWLNAVEIVFIIYLPFFWKFKLKSLKNQDIKYFLGTNITLFSIISSLLHKPHNIILNSIIILCSVLVNKSCSSLFGNKKRSRNFINILIHFWIGKAFFYYQGNSNNLSTIDLNAGYIGLDKFNIFIVGLFLTINTYNGLILSFLLLNYHLYDNSRADEFQQYKENTQIILRYFTLFVVLPFTFYSYVLYGFQDHLFIWTVFSPKILYEFYHLCLISVTIFFSLIFSTIFNL